MRQTCTSRRAALNAPGARSPAKHSIATTGMFRVDVAQLAKQISGSAVDIRGHQTSLKNQIVTDKLRSRNDLWRPTTTGNDSPRISRGSSIDQRSEPS
jgi:hypothetical protein